MHSLRRHVLSRRAHFSAAAAAATAAAAAARSTATTDLFSHVQITTKSSSRNPAHSPAAHALRLKLLGNANEFKEGDATLGVATQSAAERDFARTLIAQTTLADVDQFPVFEDKVYALTQPPNRALQAKLSTWTVGELKAMLLRDPLDKVHAVMPGLSSDVIGCVVKLCTNEDLVALGAKIFNPISPDSKLGAQGYFGARVQPNSPTDNTDDIQFQCFSAFSFAVGDLMLGTNPVSSDPASVLRVERCLQEVIEAFGLERTLPHCVLAHVDIQAKLEKEHPGSTALWFQSIASCDSANQTFDLPVDTMLAHAEARGSSQYGLYLETGQGADFTNGHAKGVDMIMHEARKFGFARAIRQRMVSAGGRQPPPRLQQNNVAGFIGPEVFRTREQLVRVCLEDIVLGKLHGLAAGLDLCCTMHMDVSLDDLDWCMDQVMPACPAWAMALPTKNDPMLSYLTTAFQDHVRVRHKFGTKVDDAMWDFFVRTLRVVRADGSPTEHFGDPAWVYLQFRRRKGDARPEAAVLAEAKAKMDAIAARGVPLAAGHGAQPWDLNPATAAYIRALYDDAKKTLWSEFSPEFVRSIPDVLLLESTSADRMEFVRRPQTGEQLSARSVAALKALDEPGASVYIVISDGLCSDAISDHGHLVPFLARLRERLASSPLQCAKPNIVVKSGRVRAGYQAGEVIFGAHPPTSGVGAIAHIIGERPGSGHHTFSCYLTAAAPAQWAVERKVDHDVTRVVSGISDSSYDPIKAADECAEILVSELVAKVNPAMARERVTEMEREQTAEH